MFFSCKQKTASEMLMSDWSSDVCSSDLLIGSREQPLATGEIIATNFDGRNQLYVFGYQVRKTGIDRGFGIIEGMPPVRNGHFYMRHRAVNSSRSMLYDMDAQRGTHRLVADIGVEDMAFVLDPRGIPQIGRASCRERWCQYVSISVGAASLKKK